MEATINKVTLYDIIAMTMPGAIIILSFIGIISNEIITLYKEINNSIIIGILYILLSYCIGWVCSELSKTIYNIKHKFLKNNKVIYLFFLCMIVAVIVGYYFMELATFIKYIYIIILVILYFLLSYKIIVNKKNKHDDELSVFLTKHAKTVLNIYYDENVEDEQIKKLAVIYHTLIQTDSKYSRIHNYNSSKSFSKNLSLAFLFLAFSFSYLMFQKNGLRFDIIYAACSLLSVIAAIELEKRYYFFKIRCDIVSMTYFIDFVKSKLQYKKGEN